MAALRDDNNRIVNFVGAQCPVPGPLPPTPRKSFGIADQSSRGAEGSISSAALKSSDFRGVRTASRSSNIARGAGDDDLTKAGIAARQGGNALGNDEADAENGEAEHATSAPKSNTGDANGSRAASCDATGGRDISPVAKTTEAKSSTTTEAVFHEVEASSKNIASQPTSIPSTPQKPPSVREAQPNSLATSTEAARRAKVAAGSEPERGTSRSGRKRGLDATAAEPVPSSAQHEVPIPDVKKRARDVYESPCRKSSNGTAGDENGSKNRLMVE